MRKAFFFRTAAVLLLLPAIIFSATSTINFSTTHQVIDGFGGSSAWSGALSDATMDALYGNQTGQIGLTILRLRIDPHAAWSDEKSNATKAKARGATVFATPWAYPESLTTNNATVKGYINTAKFASIAAYLKRVWTYYGSANVDIMSLENEPDYAQSINYEGCTWTAQNFLDFCKTYAPAIGKPIMMPESMNYNLALSNPTLNDATAAANVTYIGGHFYGGTPTTKYTLAINLKKHIWETEHYITGDGATSCMSVAKEVMDCLNNLDFNAYVWWWMTYSSNDGICTGSTPNHRGWVLAQFSKWVRPGYVRVDATYNPQTGVYVVAFKGDRYVIVAMNNNTSAQSVTFACSNAPIPSVSKYTSSQTKNGASDGTVTATNNSFTTSLDAQSVTTFVSTNTSAIFPFSSGNGRYIAEKALTQDASMYFIYTLNGKRLPLPACNGWGRAPAGIYVFPDRYTNNGRNAAARVFTEKKTAAER
jgi:glucuronoarabinoxylan endo-1,4-beta-xylanase